MSNHMHLTVITAVLTTTGFIMLAANNDNEINITKNNLDNMQDQKIISNHILIEEKTSSQDKNIEDVLFETKSAKTTAFLIKDEMKELTPEPIKVVKVDKPIAKKYSMKELKSVTKEGQLIINKYKKTFPTKESLNELENVYSLPKGLLYAVMIKESEGNPLAESHKNAKGLFQFTPITAKDFGLIVNGKDYRTNPWRSAEASARYLNWIFTYLKINKDRKDIDNYNYVLAAYNAGIGNVKSKNGLRIPPFKETIQYVKLITRHVKGQVYIVKKGDRLNNIAKTHNLSTIKLSRLNNGVSQETLIAGSYLLINKQHNELKLYKVAKGDTLYDLSKRYKISINDIKVANDMISNNIGIGQKIKIPF